MRKYMQEVITSPYKLIAVDDDAGILDSLRLCLRDLAMILIAILTLLKLLKL